MARVIYSIASLADLDRIIDYFLDQDAADTGAVAIARIRTAIEALEDHPLIGRRVEGERRELVISHGATGYLALYRFDAGFNRVRVLRIRHQREAGYSD